MTTPNVTYRQLLTSINAYPIPPSTLAGIGVARGLDIDATATSEGILSPSYRLAKADVLWWLASAPNIAQGGQNYSFSDDQRARLRHLAENEYDELLSTTAVAKPSYGYKGSRL